MSEEKTTVELAFTKKSRYGKNGLTGIPEVLTQIVSPTLNVSFGVEQLPAKVATLGVGGNGGWKIGVRESHPPVDFAPGTTADCVAATGDTEEPGRSARTPAVIIAAITTEPQIMARV